MGAENSIYMDGWTAIHHETNIRYTETCIVLHTLLSVIYSVEQSPSSEANRFSVIHEIPLILCSLEVHYRSHKCPSSVHILSHLDPVHPPHSTS